MKVLFALDSLNRGGAETHALDVVRNAGKFGIDAVFTAFGDGTLKEEFESADIDFRYFNRRSAIDFSLIRRLRRVIKSEGVEIVHGFQPVETIHLYLAALGTEAKCVQTHQGFIAGSKNRRSARLISPLVDANISVSKTLKNWLKTEIGLNTAGFDVVYNTVDENRILESEPIDRNEFGHDEFLGGMIANFVATPTKDQLTVCEALSQLFKNRLDCSFIFVGGIAHGAEENYDKCVSICETARISDRVIFAGPREDVPSVLRSLDFFVFSSRVEGLPVSVIEAMLAGVPLIVSDIEPLMEVTNEGECAKVFVTGDSASLSRQLESLLNDPAERNRLSRAGQDFARKTFGLEAHFENLIQVYERIISRKS
ncbi:MAG: glycosyltransferase family 4 protein [Pyrinomonadaceae bacterium]|nr:glycosyltransferase family 4 protein [Pyrinomonadaceae bacterium]